MNPQQPHHPEEPTLDEHEAQLLDEALGVHHTPEQLEAKVLAMTDPQFIGLLDEALAPQAPVGLAQKIIAATGPGQANSTKDAQPAVIARIGFSSWRYAAAAAIVLAAGVGLWWAGQGPDTPEQPIAGNTENIDPAQWTEVEQFAASDELFEQATQSVEATIQSVTDTLDGVTIDRDAIWSDLDAYEQFLTDIEVDSITPAT